MKKIYSGVFNIMESFKGKKFLVVGVANERSIAWSIAQFLHVRGAELAFTFVNESIEKRLRPLAEGLGCTNLFQCNVQSDEEIKKLAHQLEGSWGKFDGFLHSVAYAEREDLQKRFVETSRSGFYTAMDVSAYSLIALTQAFLPLLNPSSSILTLTYIGSERVVPNYKVMGVAKAALEATVRYLSADIGEFGHRVNAISAGPIKTLAASGIPQFKEMLSHFAEVAPLKRNVTLEDVARTALFYFSEFSSGVTGEVTFVDCGYNVLGMS